MDKIIITTIIKVEGSLKIEVNSETTTTTATICKFLKIN